MTLCCVSFDLYENPFLMNQLLGNIHTFTQMHVEYAYIYIYRERERDTATYILSGRRTCFMLGRHRVITYILRR